MSTVKTKAPVGSARERLLAAADELFYAEGVQTVGIDRIIDHAGVAKASLYNLFGSKEELVRAYLAARHERTVARLTEAAARADGPRQKLLAIFDSQARQLLQPGFHGCAFVAASTEAPVGGLIDRATTDYRSSILGLLTGLAGDAGASDATTLGRQLQLLYDGAALGARADHDPAVVGATRAAAEALIDAALGARR